MTGGSDVREEPRGPWEAGTAEGPPNESGRDVACSTCRGEGTVWVREADGEWDRDVCPDCDGEGK